MINNTQEQKNTQIKPEMTFGGLGIEQKLLDELASSGFTTPTSIQHKAIAPAIEGKDIIGIAQTGTGKTLAFGIPLVQKILKEGKNKKGLIILPTRELAIQVDETIKKIGRIFGIKTIVLIGGASMYNQVCFLRNNPHIIIGTPGRIIDHIEQRTLNLSNIETLVLDEADRMFDMGFAPQIKKIIQMVPHQRQTLLFSATMPDDIVKIASQHMKLPVRVEIAKPGTTAEKVEHELFVVKKDQKLALLKKLLIDYKGTVLVFIRVKHNARKICHNLHAVGISAAEIHSNRTLNQRREALDGFKNGKYRVLVATDIASRGIDVKNIELVINYDLPESAEDYVHRIGRTGRAGMSGKAISFAMPEQGSMIREIERLTKLYLPISKLPDISAHMSKVKVPEIIQEKRNFSQHKNHRPSGRFGYAKKRY